MFCPKCRVEYKQGVIRCKECDCQLVSELPPEPVMEYREFNSVFKTANPSLIPIVRSILDDAGIIYALKSSGMQQIFSTGEVIFQVPEESADTARKLLVDLTSQGDGEIIS